jgi:integrase
MTGKRDGLQKYRVRINYLDSYGVSRQLDRVAYGLDSAKELERQLNFDTKYATPTRKMTVQTLFDDYCAAQEREVRESTITKSAATLRFHVLPTLGDVKIDALTMPILQRWKATINDKELAIRTRQNIFKYFSALLNFAVKMEYIPRNPLVNLGNFKDSLQPKTEMSYYTADEFLKYIDAARNTALNRDVLIDWGNYVFFAVAFYTGLRKGEIHALKWSDISGEYLSVSRSIAQKLKGSDRETPPKNQTSIRTLQIPAPLMSILAEHRERCAKIAGFTDDFRICGGVRPLRDTSLENANKKFAELAGVKKIRIHDFRHSHVSLLANEGINIQEIARRLGHAKIDETWNTYSHLYPREEERAIAVLNKIT